MKSRRPARTLALEVITLFRGTVLDVHHLDPGERFTIGPDGATLPLDHPAVDARGDTPYPIAGFDDNGTARIDPIAGCPTTILVDGRIHTVDGARGVRLVPGQKARVELGDTTLLCALVHREPAVPRAPVSLLDRDGRRFMGAAAALHAVLLAIAFTVPVQAGSLHMDGFDMGNRWTEIVIRPVEEKQTEDWTEAIGPTAEPTAPDIPAQDGPPQWVQKDPEPTGGKPAEGTAEDLVARQEQEAMEVAGAVRDVVGQINAEMGEQVVAALNDLNGSDSHDPMAMGGNLWDGFGGVGVKPGTGGGPSVGSHIAINTRSRKTDKTYGGGDKLGPKIPKKGPTKGPEIVPQDPEVIGGLDREQIQRAIRKHRNAIRYCYEKGLQRNPDLQGKVRTKFVIGADGRVLTAAILDSTMGDGAVDACIAKRVQRVQFPAVRGGGAVVVTYPFLFRSGQ